MGREGHVPLPLARVGGNRSTAAAPQLVVPIGAAWGERPPRCWGLPCGSDRSRFRADGCQRARGRLCTGACRAAPTGLAAVPMATNALGVAAMSRRRMVGICRKQGEIAVAPVDNVNTHLCFYCGQPHTPGNAVYRGRGSSRGRSHRGRGGRGRGRSSDRQPSPSNGGFRGRPRQQQQQQVHDQQHDFPECQICLKHHLGGACVCWWRYEENDQEEKEAHAVSYGLDTNWYADSAATNHITGELDKLTMQEKYNGGDQIRTANGSGLGNKENHS